MTAEKFVAKNTNVVIQGGKRKVICVKGDVISADKWNKLSDKQKAYYEPAPDTAVVTNTSKAKVQEQMPPEKYEALKKMMAEQEANAMPLWTNMEMTGPTGQTFEMNVVSNSQDNLAK